jgi:hypothetical protein
MRKALLLAVVLLVASLSWTMGRATRNCAWETRIDPALVNTAYPDQFANYWVLALPATPGASLEIHGVYPHARYMSFVTYAATLQSADGLADVDIAPDSGSDNPFIAGHARNTPLSARRYTVKVKFVRPFQQRPAVRARNTLYTKNADGSKAGNAFTLIYRVYRPDRSYDGDITGGAGLPSVTYRAPGGVARTFPSCPYPEVPSNNLNRRVAMAGTTNSGGTIKHPGFDPPVWHKFQNFARSLSQGLTENGYWGTTFSDALKPAADALPQGGFADNPDNNYIFTLLSHGYGQLAVFHATMPTTPDTYPDAAVMPGGVQLRYWSMCSNDGPSQRYFGCVMDDQVRGKLDANARRVHQGRPAGERRERDVRLRVAAVGTGRKRRADHAKHAARSVVRERDPARGIRHRTTRHGRVLPRRVLPDRGRVRRRRSLFLAPELRRVTAAWESRRPGRQVHPGRLRLTASV